MGAHASVLYHCDPNPSHGTRAKRPEANPTLEAAHQSTTALLMRRPTAHRLLATTQRPRGVPRPVRPAANLLATVLYHCDPNPSHGTRAKPEAQKPNAGGGTPIGHGALHLMRRPTAHRLRAITQRPRGVAWAVRPAVAALNCLGFVSL